VAAEKPTPERLKAAQNDPGDPSLARYILILAVIF